MRGVARFDFWAAAGLVEKGSNIVRADRLCLPLVDVFFAPSVTDARMLEGVQLNWSVRQHLLGLERLRWFKLWAPLGGSGG